MVTSLLLLLFAWNLARGNPTQQVDKLFKMMSQGMAGGEDSFEFDKIYKVPLPQRAWLAHLFCLPGVRPK